MPVVITGMGIVSPIGNGVDVFWSALLEGECGIRDITRFDTDGFPFTRAGEVSSFELPADLEGRARHANQATQFLLAAAHEALSDAGLAAADAERAGIGVIVSSNFGGVTSAEHLLGDSGEQQDEDFSEYGFQRSADHVASIWNLTGPRCALSLSCSSGAAAMGLAMDWIRAGRAKAVVSGGYDVLSRFAWSGLSALRTMSTDAVRPFDIRRDGTIFSEGAGVLIVEDEDHAWQRGAPTHAELCGYGLNNNAHHLTAPSKDGRGTTDVMRMALQDSGVAADTIDHINVHGTATPHNDVAEAAAIHEIFGARAASLPVTANKSATGHMMGAAGSAEAIASIMTLRTGRIPPTLNSDEPDPECVVDLVRKHPREQAVGCLLSNSAGIGGTNAAIVLREATTP